MDLLLIFLAALVLPSSTTITTLYALNSDGLALLSLKSAISSDPTHFLRTWSSSSATPCNWSGITCNPHTHSVTHIHLPNLSLSGYIPSEIFTLSSLTHLSLSHNNFSHSLPPSLFSNPHSSLLTRLDLSHNSLSGPISPQISSLSSLTHLSLDSNLFNGSLPRTLPQLRSLSSGTLNLSYNSFSGPIPPSFGYFPVSLSLDLRHNNLSGKVPQVGSLLNQGPTAFSGNPFLCGFPVPTPCPNADPSAQDPPIPVNPINPKSSPPSLDLPTKGISLVTIPVIFAASFVVGLVFVSVYVFRKKLSFTKGKVRYEKEEEKEEKEEEKEEEGQEGRFVVMDEGFELELEDLLRASAYVVGKSRSGILYKVVVRSGRVRGGIGGIVVAVRRLSEGAGVSKFKEFEAEMETIGRVNHPNIVRLRAYYYASDEKLLITDFIPNASLYSALHGEPSNSLLPLPWAARLNIAQGIARGLIHIHECNSRKYVHGSITSSKVLLDENLQPYISGFGLTGLISANKSIYSTSQKQRSNHNALSSGMKSKTLTSPTCSYLAPEARISLGKLTQKCDIYSFGIVLLELLTGRLPDAGPEKDEKELECFVRKAFRDERPLSEIVDPGLVHEVYAKKQVLAVFHVALNCTELVPEMRPRMKTVLENLERVESV